MTVGKRRVASGRERAGRTFVHGVRVLAVDDNADALEVLTTALTGAGAAVSTAAAGAGAIEPWTRAPADVLICDLAMPDMDGFDVVRRIRELEAGRGRRAFAVALSAYASEVYVSRARESGFDIHVTKPSEPARLVALIADGMSRLA